MAIEQDNVFEFVLRQTGENGAPITTKGCLRNREAARICIHDSSESIRIAGAINALTRGAISRAMATGARMSVPLGATPCGSSVPSGSKTVRIFAGTNSRNSIQLCAPFRACPASSVWSHSRGAVCRSRSVPLLFSVEQHPINWPVECQDLLEKIIGSTAWNRYQISLESCPDPPELPAMGRLVQRYACIHRHHLKDFIG